MHSALDRRVCATAARAPRRWTSGCWPAAPRSTTCAARSNGPAVAAAMPPSRSNLVNIAAVLMYQAGRYPECVRWMLMAEPLIGEATPPQVVAEFSLGLALVGLHGGIGVQRRAQLLDRRCGIFEQQPPDGLLVLSVCIERLRGRRERRFRQRRAPAGAMPPLVEAAGAARLQGHLAVHARAWCGATRTGRCRRWRPSPRRCRACARRATRARSSTCSTTWPRCTRSWGMSTRRWPSSAALIDHLQRSPLTDAQMLAFALNWYAHALTGQGALEEAQAQVLRSLPHCRRSVGLRHFAGMLALLAARQGRLREAALLVGCDDAARQRRGERRIAQRRARDGGRPGADRRRPSGGRHRGLAPRRAPGSTRTPRWHCCPSTARGCGRFRAARSGRGRRPARHRAR